MRAIQSLYRTGGFGAGMAHFIAVTSHRGPFPDDFASQPAPDPAMFGMPTEDDGSRTDVLLAQNIIGFTHYEPDFDALAMPRPGSSSAPGPNRRVTWQTAGPMRWLSGSGSRR